MRIDLEPIKARLNIEISPSWDVHLYVNGSTYVKTCKGDLVCNVYGNRVDIAKFIANAPTDITNLIAEVERLQEVVEHQKETIDFMLEKVNS